MSKAAETHTFKKLKTPSRCRECDSYVYIQGVECLECGLASHKKCLEVLSIQCGHVKLPRKMRTFAVSLTSFDHIPLIVVKCVREIERRGATIKGIYRVSGVKSRVEKLCQSFETCYDLVDLSSQPPNVIANVLKLYFRQLPEPLLTFRLYSEFMQIAKSYPATGETVIALKRMAEKLPKIHYLTLAFLMHHLKRISELSYENNMPASNLGIVFAPTLLRSSESSSSLPSLEDTVNQTRVIELLITFSREIFGPDLSFLESSPSAKQDAEPSLFKSASCITIAGQKVVTSSSKQSIIEARRNFFTAPCSPPQFRASLLSAMSMSMSPLSPSISTTSLSNVTSHPKLRRTTTASALQSVQLSNELSRSATTAFNFASISAQIRQDTRTPKYV